MTVQTIVDKIFSYKDLGKVPEELENLLEGSFDSITTSGTVTATSGEFTNSEVTESFSVGTTLVVDGSVGEVTIDVASEAFTITGLPTADPAIAGRLWNDSGTLKISAGA